PADFDLPAMWSHLGSEEQEASAMPGLPLGEVGEPEEGKGDKMTVPVPLSVKAHGKFKQAVNAGILVRPDSCQRCGQAHPKIEGHHPDYTKPFEVEWLCPKCHKKEHRAKTMKKLHFYGYDSRTNRIYRFDFLVDLT